MECEPKPFRNGFDQDGLPDQKGHLFHARHGAAATVEKSKQYASLRSRKRDTAPSSIRRKLSALSAMFDYLCERNAVAGNPSMASSGRWRTATKAARRRSAMLRPTS
jgi:site-specific recombinase XerD